MADLQEILSSISGEDLAKLQSVAQDILGGVKENTKPTETESGLSGFDEKTVGKVMEIIGRLNKENDKTRLINDLKPLLSEERRRKADDAIRFLQLMELLPLLKGMI